MPIFPESGGSGFTGYPVQYVSPSGNNSNPGTIFAPKKTLSKARSVLASGGTIFGAPNCKWSDGTEGLGLTDGQGIWINDGSLAIPGFVGQKVVNWNGWGLTSYGPFGAQAAAWNIGKHDGSTTRDNPAIWLVGVTIPQVFNNVFISADQNVRLGWDYRRTSGLAVRPLTITNANRSGGLTTITCTLPTAAIHSFERTAGEVKVRYVLDEAYSVVRAGCYVRIAPGDLGADFPSGDYLVDTTGFIGGSTYFFTYQQGSGNKAEEFPVGATFGCHGVCDASTGPGVVELHTNTAQFPSTMYLTGGTSTDATKFILRDPYGGSHGRTANVSVNNPGTFNLQLRYIGSSFEVFNQCVFQPPSVGGEMFGEGPTFDRADIAGGAEWSQIKGCYFQGSVTGGPTAEQEIARTSAIFAAGVNAVGLGVDHLNLSQGGIYWPKLNGFCYSSFDTVLQDTGIGTPTFKTIKIDDGSGYVYINKCANADTADAHAIAADLGTAGGAITVIDTPVTGGLAGYYRTPPVIMGGNDSGAGYWASQTKSYDQMLYNGFWADDGRMAGKTDIIQSAFGVIQNPGYTNLASNNVATWTVNGDVTVTANQSTLGLDNTGKAFKLKCNSGGVASVFVDVTTPAAAAGDHILTQYWMKAVTDQLPESVLLHLLTYDPVSSKIPAGSLFTPFGNDGAWDWLYNISTLTAEYTGLTTLRFEIFVYQGHDVLVYMPQSIYLPATSYSANEAARQLKNARALPAYLPAGFAGTMPGVKLVGHGGLATAARYVVGGGSGQITLGAATGKAVELFDESGNSLGVVAPLSFTVNP